MDKQKLQWHPAFYAGIQIELQQESENLIFENEHQLGTKPKEIDVLIIKKQKDIPIKKNIGRIFRKYNIVEYKSPSDYLSIDDYYKVCAYAYFYKSDTGEQDKIPIKELTLTFASMKYPRKLISHLRQIWGYNVIKRDKGIYYIQKPEDILPIQIIVTAELSNEENLWLHSLTNEIKSKEEAEKLMDEYNVNKNNKLYDSVMDIIVKANEQKFKEAGDKMCNALEELMAEMLEERLNKRVDQKVNEHLEQLITLFVSNGINDGKTQDVIESELMKYFKITEEKAKEYYCRFS